MKVLALTGGARGGKGVTGRLLAALTEGLDQGGAEVDVRDAARLNVSPCRACLKCMLKTPGVCVQDDDMQLVYPALKSADMLVLAAPVYTDGPPAQLKAVIDRCICAMQPFLIRDAEGRVRHPANWSMPGKMVLVSTCGFPEPATFDPLIASFRAQAANFMSRPLAELCIPGSIALQMEPDRLEPHLALLSRAGLHLARGEELPADLVKEINDPPLSVDQYLEIGRRYEEVCRRRLDG